jgi:hypothetical protein
MEKLGASIKGIFRDVLKGPDGRTFHDSGWLSNTIVDSGRILLAGFMRNDSPSAIQFLAVGQGLESWDTDGVPPTTTSATDLVNRHSPPIPESELSLVYLDGADAVVGGPTNRLQITATLEPGYPEIVAPAVSFPLREFGLFGTFNGADFMINNVRHPVIHKDASATLIRVIRLYF